MSGKNKGKGNMGKKKQKRINIFVDYSHLWMSMQEMDHKRGSRPEMAFVRMHEGILSGGQPGPSCIVYRSAPPVGRTAFFSDEHERIFRELGYNIVAMPLSRRLTRCHRCGNRWQAYSEKTVDAALITGMFVAAMEMGKNDRIALVSGDADFLPALRALQTLGIQVEIWGFENHTSKHYKLDKSFRFRTLDSFLIWEQSQSA